MFLFGNFLVHIFPHLDLIRRDTEYLPIFSLNAGKYGPEKLRIRTFFTHCQPACKDSSLLEAAPQSCSLEKFSGKVVLKICNKFTGEHPCQNAISVKLLCNFIEIALQHGWSPVNLLNIFTAPFSKNTFEGLHLSLPDEEVKGMKVDILVGFQSR